MGTENRKIMKKIFSVFVFASILMLSQTLFAQTVKVGGETQNYTIVTKDVATANNIEVLGGAWSVTSIVDADGIINTADAAYTASGADGASLILPYTINGGTDFREATVNLLIGSTPVAFTFIQAGTKPLINNIIVDSGVFGIGDVIGVSVTFTSKVSEEFIANIIDFNVNFDNGGTAVFNNAGNIFDTDMVVLSYTVDIADENANNLTIALPGSGPQIPSSPTNSLVSAASVFLPSYTFYDGDIHTATSTLVYADLPEILAASPTSLTNAAAGNNLTITASNFANRIFLVKEGTSISSVSDLVTAASTYSATYAGTPITMAANSLPVDNKPTQNYTLYAVDVVNNISSAYLTPIVVSDVVDPIANITGPAGPVNGSFDVNVTFNEKIPVFNSGDITLDAASLANSLSITGFDVYNQNNATVHIDGNVHSGNVTLTIPGGVNGVVDANGNTDADGAVFTVFYDASGPVATITTAVDITNSTDEIIITIEFDENLKGGTDLAEIFDVTDLTVTGATIVTGSLTATVPNTKFTVKIKADPNNDEHMIVFEVLNGGAQALDGGGTIGKKKKIKFDAVAPVPVVTTSYKDVTPTVDVPTGKLSGDSPMVVTVEFPEEIVGFDIDKVIFSTLPSGSKTAVISTPSELGNVPNTNQYTFNITPTIPIDFGEVTISIAANSASDKAGNWAVASATSWTYTYLGAPVLVKLYEINPIDITPDPNAYSPSNNDIVVKVDFYRNMENVANFKQSDVTVTFTPDAGAANVATTNNFFALESPASTQFGTERFIYSFNVDQSATATQGNFTFEVAENKLFDIVGNGNTTSNTLTVRYDAIGAIPTVTTDPDLIRENTPFAVTVDFGEAVTGFDENMLVSSYGTPGKATPVFVSAGKYTVMVTPTVDEVYTFSVSENANLKDLYGNLVQTSTVNETVIWDTTSPVPTVTSALVAGSRKTNISVDPIQIEVNYGEPILAGFTTSSTVLDVNVISGTVAYTAATDFSYVTANAATGMLTFNIAPVGQGTITVSVRANMASDLATNKNVVSAAVYTIVMDNKAPTPVITVPSIPHEGFGNLSVNPVPVTVTFDEDVTQIGSHGLHVGNVVADGAIQMVMVSANVYSFNLDITTTNSYSTASSANLTILTVNVGNFQDAALNDCLPALYSFTFDGLQPIPTIIPMNVGFNRITNLTTISTKIVFNNGMMGFTPATPVVSSNANKGGYTATATTATVGFDTFTLDLSPVNPASGNELITMTIPANVSGVGGSYPFTATNISIGNPATASSIYSITTDRRIMTGSVYSFTYDGAGPVCTSIVTDVPDNSDVQLIGSNYYVKGGTSTLSIAIDFTDDHKIDAFDINDVTITADAGSTVTVANATIKTAGTPGSTFYGVIVELNTVAGDGSFTVDLLAGATTDEAGNESLAYTTPWKFVIDNERPIPTITVDNPVITEGAITGIDNITDEHIFVNVDFGEAMTSFNSSDLSVTFGGTLSTATNVILDNVNGLYRFELDLATTPLPSHIVAIWVNNNVVQDGSGNDNSTNAASYFSFSYDPVAPIPTISNYYGAPIFSFNVTITSPIVIKVDFGEDIGGFTTSDLATFTSVPFLGTNSDDLSEPVSIGVGIYTFSITPDMNPGGNRVNYTIGMGANMATDNNGNYNVASNIFEFTYDKLAAVPTITSPEVAFEGIIGNNVDNTIAIEIDFGTQMLASTFTTGDISVSSTGDAGPFYLSSLGAVNNIGLYSFNIDPTVAEATATVELWIENPSILGNSGLPCEDDWRVGSTPSLGHFSFTYDGVRPVPTIYSLAVPFGATNILSVPMTVEFSKTVSAPSITDFTFSPGVTPSAVTTVNATTYVFDLVIDATTTLVTIGINDAAVKEVDLLNTSTTASFSFLFDGVRPHPTITAKRAGANYPNGTMTKVDEDVFEITVDFGEQMFGNNAFLSTEIVPRYTGTVSASSVTYANWISHDEIGVYTFTTTIAKDLDGTIVFDIAENVTSDGATNQNYALTYAPFGQTTFTIVHDGVEPMPTISSAYLMDGIYKTSTIKEDPVVLTVNFGEEVNYMNMNVLIEKGGVLSPTSPTGWLTGSVFTITCDVPASYEMKAIDFEMYVANGMVTDKAGNYNSDSRWNGMGFYTVVYDGNVPVPTISTVAGNALGIINSEPTPFTVEFNRPVNEANFIAATINQTIKTGDLSGLNFTLGATKSISSSVNPGFAAIYTFELDVPGTLLEGTYTLDIAADVTSSVAGKYNNVSSQYTFVFDNKGPMPVISTPNAGSNWVNTPSTPITVSFAEEMQAGEFILADISSNAAFKSNWNANDGTNGFDGNAIYSFAVTLTAPFTTIGIDAGVAHDIAGNANSAYSPTYSIFYDNVPLTIDALILSPLPTEYPEAAIFTYNVFETTVGAGVASVTVTCTGNGATNGTTQTLTYPMELQAIPTFSEALSVLNSTIFNATWEGPAKIDISATDHAGNITTYPAINFTYDGLQNTPTVTCIYNPGPVDGQVPLEVNFADIMQEINSSMITFTPSDPTATITATFDSYTANQTLKFNLDITKPEPTTMFTITVNVPANTGTDRAGNTTEAATYTINYLKGVLTPSIYPTIEGKDVVDNWKSRNMFINMTIEHGLPIYPTASRTLLASDIDISRAINNGKFKFSVAPQYPGLAIYTFNVNVLPEYQFTEFPVELEINPATYSYAGGITNRAAYYSFLYDGVSPKPVISAINPETGLDNGSGFTTNLPVVLTVDYGEVVNTFEASHIDLTGTVGSNGFGATGVVGQYTMNLTPPLVNELLTISIGNGLVQDINGNWNSAAVDYLINFDVVAPRPTITSNMIMREFQTKAGLDNTAFDMIVTFGEEMKYLDRMYLDINIGNPLVITPADDMLSPLSGEIMGNDVPGNSDGIYSFEVPCNLWSTPASDRNISAFSRNEHGYLLDVTVLPGIEDLAGNLTGKSGNWNIQFDMVRPEPTITALNVKEDAYGNRLLSAPLIFEVKFDEYVTGFELNDISATAVNANLFTAINQGTIDLDNGIYTFKIEPDLLNACENASNLYDFQLNANAAYDLGGNMNTSSPTYSFLYDACTPKATVEFCGEGVAKRLLGPTNKEIIPVKITFSEEVIGFTSENILIENLGIIDAPVAEQVGLQWIYTFNLYPIDVIVKLDLDINGITDLAGNKLDDENPGGLHNLLVIFESENPIPVFKPLNATKTEAELLYATEDKIVTFEVKITEETTIELADIMVDGANMLSKTLEMKQSVSTTVGADNYYVGYFSVTMDGDPPNDFTVKINEGSFMDLIKNDNAAYPVLEDGKTAAAYTIYFDNTDPKPVITTIDGRDLYKRGEVIGISVDFNEVVKDLSYNDVKLASTEGTKAAWSAKGGYEQVYTFNTIPMISYDDVITITIPANVVKDYAGRSNEAGVLTFTYDGVVPTPVLSTTDKPVNENPIITVTFDEAVTPFNGDVTSMFTGLPSVSIANVAATSTVGVYAVTIAGLDGELDFKLKMKAGVVADNAGNLNPESNEVSVMFDNSAPVPTITATVDEGSRTNVASVTLTVEYGEAVDAIPAITENGSASTPTAAGVTGDKNTGIFNITLDLTGNVEETITTSVAAAAVNDLAGNASSAGEFVFIYDKLAPTATISSIVINSDPAVSNNIDPAAIVLDIDFSEPVYGTIEAADFTLVNADVVGTYVLNGQQTVAVTVTPSTPDFDDIIEVTLNPGVVTDEVNSSNTSEKSNTYVFDYDNIIPIPTITIDGFTSGDFTNEAALYVTVDFDEEVADLDITEIFYTTTTSTGGNASPDDIFNIVDKTNGVYVFRLEGIPVGTIALNIKDDVVVDNAGNNNDPNPNNFIIKYDHVSPVPFVSSVQVVDGYAKDAVTLDINWSEEVKDFTTINVTVDGTTTVTAVTTPNTLVITKPSVDTEYTISIPAGAAKDQAGNSSDALTPDFTFTIDVTAPRPTVIVEGLTSGVVELEDEDVVEGVLAITVEFGDEMKPVASFNALTQQIVKMSDTHDDDLGDATVVPGTIVWSNDNSTLTYQVEIKDGLYAAKVATNQFADIAGNMNTDASNRVEIEVFETHPKPVITFKDGASTTDNSPIITVTWSNERKGIEDVSASFDPTTDLILGNATVGTVSSDSAHLGIYKIELLLKDDAKEGDITVDIDANVCSDAYGNANLALVPTFELTIDAVVPMPTITVNNVAGVVADGATVTDEVSVTVDFGEYVQAGQGTGLFDVNDNKDVVLTPVDEAYIIGIDETGADNGVYVFTIAPKDPNSFVDFKILVPAGVTTDNVGKANLEADFEFTFDGAPPVPVITADEVVYDGIVDDANTIHFNVEFTEEVSELTADMVTVKTLDGDIIAIDNWISNSGEYTFAITPQVTEVEISVSIAMDVVTDVNSVGNEAGEFTFYFEAIIEVPVVQIETQELSNASTELIPANSSDNTGTVYVIAAEEVLPAEYMTVEALEAIIAKTETQGSMYEEYHLGAKDVDGLYDDGTAGITPTRLRAGVYYAYAVTNTGLVSAVSLNPITIREGIRPIAMFEAIGTGSTVDFIDKSMNVADYSWNFGDGTSDEMAQNVIAHKYESVGTYTVILTVTGTNGEEATHEEIVEISTDVVDIDSELNISVYPNPSNGLFNVDYNSNGSISDAVLKIMDASGRLIKVDQFDVNDKTFNRSYDISNYNIGTYFIQLETENGIQTKTVILQK